jgi:hypothetical protein
MLGKRISLPPDFRSLTYVKVYLHVFIILYGVVSKQKGKSVIRNFCATVTTEEFCREKYLLIFISRT